MSILNIPPVEENHGRFREKHRVTSFEKKKV
jgi:hypothetical protein